MTVLEKRKSNMTETTFPLSEFEGSPSVSFKEIGEPDVGPLAPTPPLSSKSLDVDSESTSEMRIHQIRSNRGTSPPQIEMLAGGLADSMPSVPKRRGSYASEMSERQSLTLYEFEIEEDDTIHESNHESLHETEDEIDDLSSKPPMERSFSTRQSDSERRFSDKKDAIPPPIAPPVRMESAPFLDDNSVASGTKSTVTDEAIENMILSQIPEHIRNQMTPEMWKQIFTVNAISKHSGAVSVCSELTDDLALRSTKSQPKQPIKQSPPTKQRSIDHTGSIADVSPTSTKNNSDFVTENLESHSTFRTEDSKDLLSVGTPSSYRSTSSTKDEDTNTSGSSPNRRAPKSTTTSESSPNRRAPTPATRFMSPNSSKKSPRTTAERVSHRRARHQNGASGDAPPVVPRKVRSLRTGRETIPNVSESIDRPSSENQDPKKTQFSVRFCPQCDVRNYERVLEVHPSTSSGPSLGIGWEFVESTAKVSWGVSPDKRYGDMLLTRQARERIVRVELGYSAKEIAKAVRENLKIKNQRRRTVNNLQEYNFAPVEKVEYMLEKCQRKLAKIGLGRKSTSQTSITFNSTAA
mmetsp:Transcript_21901/g.54118  ORF Transcript_21901/g.54118 Transcript_21901/m.54118 type:complete len:579 (+) Transcript_21901:56-1792(+)